MPDLCPVITLLYSTHIHHCGLHFYLNQIYAYQNAAAFTARCYQAMYQASLDVNCQAPSDTQVSNLFSRHNSLSGCLTLESCSVHSLAHPCSQLCLCRLSVSAQACTHTSLSFDPVPKTCQWLARQVCLCRSATSIVHGLHSSSAAQPCGPQVMRKLFQVRIASSQP